MYVMKGVYSLLMGIKLFFGVGTDIWNVMLNKREDEEVKRGKDFFKNEIALGHANFFWEI